MYYYHIVDHSGFGTMHKLIKPLCDKYNNHILMKSDDFLLRKDNDAHSIYVIHTSGGGKTKILCLLKKYVNLKFIVFIHTSYNYQLYKKRYKLLNLLREYNKMDNIKIVVPSNEVAKIYKKNNIDCEVVQLGIKPIDEKNLGYKDELKKYYNKIITTCSSYKKEYQYIKGIDLFTDFVIRNNLVNESLILGINDDKSLIMSKELSEEDFINVLYHSKLYLQLSRMESYNLTAVQAKQLKKPIVLLRAEGNYDCMKGNVYESIEETEKVALDVLTNNFDSNDIEKLYYDSINRENLQNFKNSMEEIII